MEKNFFRAVAVMAIAVLCGSAANAQNEIVNEDSTAVETQVINQKKGAKVTRVKKVVKTAAREDSVIYKNGTSEVYTDQAVAQMSDETLDGILSGDIKAVKRTNKNYDGELRRRAYIGVAGGCIFGDQVDPMVGAMVGYMTWNFDFSLSGYWTQAHMPDHADNPGERENAMYFYLDATWKGLHTSNGYFWIGPGLGVGYGHQKTNDLDNGGSTNSGVTGRAFLAANWQATRHLTLGLKAGAMLKVLVDHAENGTEWQEISKNTIKPFIAAEVKVNF